jgi:hypothetical protein
VIFPWLQGLRDLRTQFPRGDTKAHFHGTLVQNLVSYTKMIHI